MSGFLNLAKEGYTAYKNSQENVSKTGGEEYNRPAHGQNQDYNGPDIDHNQAIQNASSFGSGESSLFSSALGFLQNNSSAHQDPVNEDHVTNAHQQAYENGSAGSLSASSMGSAAALQALKNFTSGGGSSGGGNTQTQLISMAMAEASKLFDSSGGAASGNKQDAVNGAAMTVMKLLVQSKFGGAGGSIIGGGNSGGLGSLMSLASKFA